VVVVRGRVVVVVPRTFLEMLVTFAFFFGSCGGGWNCIEIEWMRN
jgi:hypothetical protein